MTLNQKCCPFFIVFLVFHVFNLNSQIKIKTNIPKGNSNSHVANSTILGNVSSKIKNAGVITNNYSVIENGYTLISPSNSTKTFLIDNEGKLVNQWSSKYFIGQTAYLMEDGSLIRSCKSNNTKFKFAGIGGRLEKRDWNNKLVWEWELNDTNQCLHHDITPLPNGNILVIVIQRKFIKDVLLAGRDTSKLTDKELWLESILEIQPKEKNKAVIVWKWDSWNHLIQNKFPNALNYNKIENHPELIDINANLESNSSADLLHFNSVDYNPQLNQILISVRNFNEIWIIDHSTNTEQAKSHTGVKSNKGGDLLYRWGNPKSYGINEPAQLDGQHNASWVKNGYVNEGKITIFDNRATTTSSRLIMIEPPLNKLNFDYNKTPNKAYLPKNETWSYTQDGLNQGRGGSVQALPNGNFLFCETSRGRLTEITPKNDTAWMYVNPVTETGLLVQGEQIKNTGGMFKADKYSSTFKGFSEKNMTPGAKLEMNSDMVSGRIEITPKLDSLVATKLSLSSNCFLNIDEKKLFYNKSISVYNSEGILIDEQSIMPKGKWYLGLYKEGKYYFKCKNNITKIIISK